MFLHEQLQTPEETHIWARKASTTDGQLMFLHNKHAKAQLAALRLAQLKHVTPSCD